jgi:hypothetical protein
VRPSPVDCFVSPHSGEGDATAEREPVRSQSSGSSDALRRPTLTGRTRSRVGQLVVAGAMACGGLALSTMPVTPVAASSTPPTSAAGSIPPATSPLSGIEASSTPTSAPAVCGTPSAGPAQAALGAADTAEAPPNIPEAKTTLSAPYKAIAGKPDLGLRITYGDQTVSVSSRGPGVWEGKSADLTVTMLHNDTGTQVIGTTNRTDPDIALAVGHELACSTEVVLLKNVGDVTVVYATSSAGTRPVAWVSKPWATDAHGHELPTHYTVSGATLVQHVDATGAATPVTFDPTYSFISCDVGYYSDRNAAEYINMWTNDIPDCPVFGMFVQRNNYFPVMGYQASVYDDYGLVAVRQSGSCTGIPDTAAWYDFQVPCKAHDYCYDLRKAGFSGTVTDGDCDSTFYDLMGADCNNRSGILGALCQDTRTGAYLVVSSSPVVTDADPAKDIVFRPMHNIGYCMDVYGSFTINDAAVLQYPCSSTSNELYQIFPAGVFSPGLFEIRPMHTTGKCVDRNVNNGKIASWDCHAYSQQHFRIQGAFSQDNYTIRSEFSGFNQCLDVTGRSFTVVQLQEYSCAEADNQRWAIGH